MKVSDMKQRGQIVMKEFPREQVRVVVRQKPSHDPYRTLAISQGVGAVGGAIALGIASKHAWPAGALFGGLGGFAGGTIVGGVIGTGELIASQRDRIVYQAERAPVAQNLDPASMAPVF